MIKKVYKILIIVYLLTGSMFLPPTTAIGASLFSISVYGGLVLFSAFLLYDTQKIMKRAETHPPYSVYRYDPVKE